MSKDKTFETAQELPPRPDVAPAGPPKHKKGKDATRKQIRGSSLLLLGKIISVGLNFTSQVLIVRYLTKADYGAWAYALAAVNFFTGFASFGLDRAITRFIPIFEEKEEYAKLFGTIILTVASIILTSALIIGGLYFAPDVVASLVGGDNPPVSLVLVLIFMVPVEGFNGTIIGLFSCFSSPKAIFSRKFIYGPLVKLSVIILLIIFESDVLFLAYGYLAGHIAGIIFFSWVLYRMMVKRGLIRHFSLKNIHIPALEIFTFTVPLLTSDLVSVLMHSSDALMLGYFHNTAEVASYQVILPASHFNKLVMMSFALLYTPLAARLFAREDYKGINNLYWTTAIWMSVLSFPLFAITFSLAEPLTLLLYGERYAESWIFLQMLSFAYYFNVVLGFNGLTLKVLGKLRYVVIVNVVAMLINVGLNLLLIPQWGAFGAALATMTSMIAHNILKQAGLRLASGIAIFDWHYLSFYLIIFGGAAILFLVERMITKNIFVLIPLAAVLSLIILKLSQEKLKIAETFPELLKIPFVNKILGITMPPKQKPPEK